MQPPTHGGTNGPPQASGGVINVDLPVPPPLLEKVSKFVKLVKEYNPQVFYCFLEMLRNYDEQSNNSAETGQRVGVLFNDHVQLRQSFTNLEMEFKLTAFLAKLKDRLAINDNQRYLKYFEIIQEFDSGQKSKEETVAELFMLFANHIDLFWDFWEFCKHYFREQYFRVIE